MVRSGVNTLIEAPTPIEDLLVSFEIGEPTGNRARGSAQLGHLHSIDRSAPES